MFDKNKLYAARIAKRDLMRKAEAIHVKGDLSAADEAEFTRLMALVKEKEALITELEVQLDAENGMQPAPDENAAFAAAAHGGAYPTQIAPSRTGLAKQRALSGKVKFAQLFGASGTGGFKDFGEFIRAINMSGQVFDPRLKASATEKSPGDGGFLVPPDFSSQILDESLEEEIVRPRATVWPMASETRQVPAVRDDDHSGGSLFGGVVAAWADELGTLANADVKMRLIELHASKLGMLTNCSNELLEDSSFEAVLSAKLTAAAAWHLDNAFLYGTGAGQPLGILTSQNKALVIVPKETNQPADTIVFENITNMFGAMAPRHRRRATWVFNDQLIPQLLRMQLVVKSVDGTTNVGGSAVPVFSMAPDGTMLLLTRPVVFTEKLAVPGDQGDALFCDFTEYAIGIRRNILLEKSREAGFATDSSYFRLTCRVDGQPTWPVARKLKQGNSVSPYVTLQAR